jgi:hypothetical protein
MVLANPIGDSLCHTHDGLKYILSIPAKNAECIPLIYTVLANPIGDSLCHTYDGLEACKETACNQAGAAQNFVE